jgi:hypothetical protein
MHLSGEANTVDLISSDARVVQCEANGLAAGSPPIPGILLRPTRLRGCERRVVFCSGRNYSSVIVHDEGTGPAGTDIDSEERDIPSLGRARDSPNSRPSRTDDESNEGALLSRRVYRGFIFHHVHPFCTLRMYTGSPL